MEALMSYDKSQSEYCLTLRGWVTTGNLQVNEIVIERWLEKTYQGSGFGKESTHGTMLWSNADFSKKQRDELHNRFPSPWSEEETAQRKKHFSRDIERLAAEWKISN
jgi:hypothetical protein